MLFFCVVEFYNSISCLRLYRMNQTDKFLPRYIQFANQIQTQISRGTLKPDEMLPPQRQLAEQFGTTLMTIRKAINVLEEEGLLRSEHGVGTFVARPDLAEDSYQLFSFSAQMNETSMRQPMHQPTRQPAHQSAYKVETRVLLVDPKVEHEKARQALRLSRRSGISLLERLRVRNEIPFAYQRSYLPAKFAAMLKKYTADSSLYGLLQTELEQPMTTAKEYVVPIVLSAAQAKKLKGKRNDPAWLSVRISANQDGVPLVYDEAILKHDCFLLTIEHTGKRTNCQLQMVDERSPEPFEYLLYD